MRLWSIHPRYLDSKGLVALWREGLLAKAVLEGNTNGYTHHPQLTRFREQPDPISAIHAYLYPVLEEARIRGYRFDSRKIDPSATALPIPLTTGQLAYEWQHLLHKLETRDPKRYRQWAGLSEIEPHPLMRLIEGPVANWEITR